MLVEFYKPQRKFIGNIRKEEGKKKVTWGKYISYKIGSILYLPYSLTGYIFEIQRSCVLYPNLNFFGEKKPS
jgi:hypothetical protein